MQVLRQFDKWRSLFFMLRHRLRKMPKDSQTANSVHLACAQMRRICIGIDLDTLIQPKILSWVVFSVSCCFFLARRNEA